MLETLSVAGGLWVAMAAPFCAAYGAALANRTAIEGARAPEAPLLVTIALSAATWAVVVRAPDGFGALSAAVLMSGLAYLCVFDLRFMAAPILPILVMAGLGVGAGFLIDVQLGVERAGAMGVGWVAFSALAAAYQSWRGRMGLGAGDALVAGLIGAWLSFEGLAWSVALGGAFGLLWALRRGADRAIPLIPALCAGVILYLLGQDILA